jgi:Flp pilus assembly CpaE family ATPase
MTDDAPAPFTIECPCCKAKITVDATVRAVLHHEAAPEKRTVTDINEAISKFEGQAAEREKKFADNMAAEHNKQERLGKQFDDLFKKAQTDDGKPVKPRDIDLD